MWDNSARKQLIDNSCLGARNVEPDSVEHFNQPNLLEMVRQANGMLPVRVYEALYECVQHAPGKSFVEVGTAHGAATIALALGAQNAGLDVCIHAIDQLGGRFSSRTRFGSVEENRAIVQENFARAVVTKHISLFVGTTDEFVASGCCPSRIDLLMLDADGRIDRDLLHFYDLLAPNALIVIDDVDRGIYLGTAHDGTPYLDLKHRITSLLLAALKSQGFLRVENTVHCTAFCRRGERNMDHQEFSRLALSCYRDLVFNDLPGPEWKKLAQWHVRHAKLRRIMRLINAMAEFAISIGRAGRRLVQWRSSSHLVRDTRIHR